MLKVPEISRKSIFVATQIDRKTWFSFQEPEFAWTSIEQGVILSSFFCGYLLSPIGGILASNFGGVTTFTLGTMATGLLNAVSPFLMKYNLYLYLAERFFEGLFEVILS